MPRRQPDRDLRRLVADLATTAPSDIEAILESLEPDQRRAVAGLLEEYVGRRERPKRPPPSPKHTPPEETVTPRIPGLSPWLAYRLREVPADAPAPRRGPGRPSVVAAITPAALETLRSCAATLAPPANPARPTLVRRARRLLAGRQASR